MRLRQRLLEAAVARQPLLLASSEVRELLDALSPMGPELAAERLSEGATVELFGTSERSWLDPEVGEVRETTDQLDHATTPLNLWRLTRPPESLYVVVHDTIPAPPHWLSCPEAE